MISSLKSSPWTFVARLDVSPGKHEDLMSLPSLEPAPKGPDSEAQRDGLDKGNEAMKLMRLLLPTKRIICWKHFPFDRSNHLVRLLCCSLLIFFVCWVVFAVVFIFLEPGTLANHQWNIGWLDKQITLQRPCAISKNSGLVFVVLKNLCLSP